MKREVTQERKVTTKLPIVLSEREKNELGDAAAELNSNLKADKTEFAKIRKDWGSRIKDKEKRRDELLLAILEGEEEREMDAIEVKNFEEKSVTYLDCANPKKELHTRPMTEDELQMEMDDDTAGKVTKIRKGKRLGPNGEDESTDESEEIPFGSNEDFSAPSIGAEEAAPSPA